MSLKVTTAGPVELFVDPAEVVTEDHFLTDPGRYAPESERMKKWRDVIISSLSMDHNSVECR